MNRWMDGARLTGLHGRIFALAALIFTFDGYDLFIYSGSIPLVMREFGIGERMAGAIASYMLMGALVGALFLGTLADRIGRKRALLYFIALFSLGMFMVSRAQSPVEFAFWRFVTGLGVGASQPNITAYATEFAPRRRRSVLVAALHGGMNIGGIAAALISMALYAHYSWRSVYLVGALPLFTIPLFHALLPESPLRMARSGQFDKVRALMRRLRPQEPVPDDCALTLERGRGRAPILEIFAAGRARSTVLFWCAQFMNSYGLFGFTIWLPRLIMSRGYSLNTGLTFLLMISTMAILGSFLGGALADKIGSKTGLTIFYLTSFASVALVGVAHSFPLLMALACLAGVGYHGAANILGAYLPPFYPPSMRSTATSVAYALSRIGALIGPFVIGALVEARFSYPFTLITLASPVLISVACILLIQERYSFAREVAGAA